MRTHWNYVLVLFRWVSNGEGGLAIDKPLDGRCYAHRSNEVWVWVHSCRLKSSSRVELKETRPYPSAELSSIQYCEMRELQRSVAEESEYT